MRTAISILVALSVGFGACWFLFVRPAERSTHTFGNDVNVGVFVEEDGVEKEWVYGNIELFVYDETKGSLEVKGDGWVWGTGMGAFPRHHIWPSGSVKNIKVYDLKQMSSGK